MVPLQAFPGQGSANTDCQKAYSLFIVFIREVQCSFGSSSGEMLFLVCCDHRGGLVGISCQPRSASDNSRCRSQKALDLSLSRGRTCWYSCIRFVGRLPILLSASLTKLASQYLLPLQQQTPSLGC